MCPTVHADVCPAVRADVCPAFRADVCPAVHADVCPTVCADICPTDSAGYSVVTFLTVELQMSFKIWNYLRSSMLKKNQLIYIKIIYK